MGPYQTPLQPWERRAFDQWIDAMSAKLGWRLNPDDPTYDYRGFWRSQQLGGRGMGLDPGSGEMHFPDTFKTPEHPTFSRESIYATPDAPYWTDKDVQLDKEGKVTLGYLRELMRQRGGDEE